MRSLPALVHVAAFLAVLSASSLGAASGLWAQAPAAPTQAAHDDVPTLHATSSLVFLDVTVLDKKGHPVVTGLTKDDFTITEDKRPQRIFSFEAPEIHTRDRDGGDEPDGKAPATIFVLDLLNSEFADFAYIRYSVKKYLDAQPERMASPAEMLVVGNDSLELIQGFTRSRKDLLFALNHLPAALPYKRMNASFAMERFAQSIDALQQIALQNKGAPGRKNVIWVGHGGPNLNTNYLPSSNVELLDRYIHDTANILVQARISLFVIYPGLKVENLNLSQSALDADASIGDDPFAGDINFGVFVNDTGGNLFFNRNDVDAEMRRSQELGSQYYTLTYQPHESERAGSDDDGRFRRIRVTLRNKNLQVITKAGYYAPEKGAQDDPQHDPRQRALMDVTEALHSTIPFTGLDVSMACRTQHPDTATADISIELTSKNLGWQPTEDGKSITSIVLAVASLNSDRKVLASKLERIRARVNTQDPARLSKALTGLTITIRVPRKTQNVRVVAQSDDGERMGAAELSRKTILSAPASPTPEPHLDLKRPDSGPKSGLGSGAGSGQAAAPKQDTQDAAPK